VIEHWLEDIAATAAQALAGIGEVKSEQVHSRVSIDNLTLRVDRQNGKVHALETWQREEQDKELAAASYAKGAATALVSREVWASIKASWKGLVAVVAAAFAAGTVLMPLLERMP
jgi:hypothetical protein